MHVEMQADHGMRFAVEGRAEEAHRDKTKLGATTKQMDGPRASTGAQEGIARTERGARATQ